MDDQAGLDGLVPGPLSASRTRGAMRSATSRAITGGRSAGRAPPRPQSEDWSSWLRAFESVVAQGEPGQGSICPANRRSLARRNWMKLESCFRQALLSFCAVRPWYTNRPSLPRPRERSSSSLRSASLHRRGRSARGSAAHCARRTGGIAGRRIEHGEQASSWARMASQAQFRFTVADPALPRLILRHVHLPKAGYGTATRGVERRLAMDCVLRQGFVGEPSVGTGATAWRLVLKSSGGSTDKLCRRTPQTGTLREPMTRHYPERLPACFRRSPRA